jgi:hypothetical protein
MCAGQPHWVLVLDTLKREMIKVHIDRIIDTTWRNGPPHWTTRRIALHFPPVGGCCKTDTQSKEREGSRKVTTKENDGEGFGKEH